MGNRIFGYSCVGTSEQNLDRQIEQLENMCLMKIL